MAYQIQPNVQIDWPTLKLKALERQVPVCLFVLTKTIVEGDGGALALNGTIVQRAQVVGATTPIDPNEDKNSSALGEGESDDKHLKDLMFGIKLKGPLSGGEIKSRRPVDVQRTALQDHTTWLCTQTYDLVDAPMNVQSVWSWFPFRILEATVEIELQSKKKDFGQGGVNLCPTLCVSDPKKHAENLVRTRPMEQANQTRTLALLLEKPRIEIVEDVRRKARSNEQGEEQSARPIEDDVFVTFPLMRLTFWLHEPISKAVFKVLGPLLLVVILLWVNYHEFYGIFNLWEGTGEDRDSDYLANGIGIAITAVYMMPQIRAENRRGDHRRGDHLSFTGDDYVALIFLVGLGISTVKHRIAAFLGVCISSTVVIGAMASMAAYNYQCSKIKKKASEQLYVWVDSGPLEKKVKVASQDFSHGQWMDAHSYRTKVFDGHRRLDGSQEGASKARSRRVSGVSSGIEHGIC